MKNNYYGEPEHKSVYKPEKSGVPKQCFDPDHPEKKCLHYLKPACKSPEMKHCSKRLYETRRIWEARNSNQSE